MFKNTAGQKLTVFAFDATTGLPKSGDAANITAYASIDDGTVTVLADTSATEMDATNAKGYYLFDLAQAETNGNKLQFSAKSSTANIVVVAVPAVTYTTVDVAKIGGTSQTARDVGASVLLSVGTGAGQVNLASGNVPATLASGDFTATMKTSLNAATPASVTAPVSVNLSQAVPLTGNTANTLGDCLNAARAQGFGKWTKSGTTLTLYGPDGTTIVRTFNLDDASTPTTRS